MLLPETRDDYQGMAVVSIALSEKKGTGKRPIERARLIEGHGLEGDAHAGSWHRQISFLASESIFRTGSDEASIGYGDYAENIATKGVEWRSIAPGQRIRIGGSVIVEITQIGKACHGACEIYRRLGDCIMPREGVFGKVLSGGDIRVGDALVFIDGGSMTSTVLETGSSQGSPRNGE